jgi:hypothetical protein
MSTRPRIDFDTEGKCNACRWALEKKNIDWRQFLNYSTQYNCLNENIAVIRLLEEIHGQKYLSEKECVCNEQTIGKSFLKLKNCVKYGNNPTNRNSLSSQLLSETEHLPTNKKIIVVLGRLFPSKKFLESRYGRVNNYFLVIINRYLVYLKR